MGGQADSDLLIAPAGGLAWSRLPASGVRLSWQVSRAGTLSAFMPANTAHDVGLSHADVRGMWVTYWHPTAGEWGGQITAVDWRDAEVEIAAESYLTLLRRRRAPRQLRPATMQAGAIFRYAVTQAAGDRPVWYTSIRADEDGDLLTWEFRHDDLHDDLLPRLLTNHEVEFTSTRALNFVNRIGADISHRCHLLEGVHLANVRLMGDLWAVRNDLVAVAGNDTYTAGEYYQVEDNASIAQYGRLEDTAQLRGTVDRTQVVNQLRAEIATSAAAVDAIEATVLDVNGCWSEFREGDTVLMSIPTANSVVRARVMARALDVGSGTMSVSADVVDILWP
ncbi:MAG: hypothetical protein H0U10_15660 [Chloroflexia bacterium]|nr:hypothetical protein [Chloroflexia bacterium]